MNFSEHRQQMLNEVGRVAREYYRNALPVPEKKKCVCGRSPYLWGGETCDVCDTDNNGTIDVDEAAGIGPTPRTASLFQFPEKGWRITQGATVERVPRNWREKGWQVISEIRHLAGRDELKYRLKQKENGLPVPVYIWDQLNTVKGQAA